VQTFVSISKYKMADSTTHIEDITKQSEHTHEAVAETTAPSIKSAKKRKQAEVQLDEHGKPIKAARKPFVWTDKRKEAFEECKRKREIKIAQRKQADEVAKAAEREVRQQIRALRTLMQSTDPQIISNTLSQTVHSVQQLGSLSSTPTSAPDLTVSSTMPNVAPSPQSAPIAPSPPVTIAQTPTPQLTAVERMEEEQENLMKVEVEEEQSMITSASQMFPPSNASPSQTLTGQTETQSMAMVDPRTQRQKTTRFDVDEVPIHAGKRKVAHLRMGTGAGNHEPYEGEENYQEIPTEQDTRYDQYQRGTINVDELSDEELALFMLQARQSAEQRNLFSVRRTNGKMIRPSHASMFLDHAYVHESTNHPSSLASRSLPHQPPSRVAARESDSQFMWL
jgi:hypothetical protein